MGLLPDTWNCGLRMLRECRECFPCHRLQWKPLVSDLGMHHGTYVTHVPWFMSGSLTCGGGENVPGIPGACATCNFAYLVRTPFPEQPMIAPFTAHYIRHQASMNISFFNLSLVYFSIQTLESNQIIISGYTWSHEQILYMIHHGAKVTIAWGKEQMQYERNSFLSNCIIFSIGRRKTIIVCIISNIIASIITTFSVNYVMFTCLRFFVAMSSISSQSVFLVLGGCLAWLCRVYLVCTLHNCII